MTLSGFARRRGGRSVAAVLAAMLVASVLAVVAGAPAQAANTAHEVLYDHDNDASTDMVREFAGVDRYDTALRLAENFAEAKGGIGTVPVVFLSSGESLVDSISAAGLAGYNDAPILLTPGEALPRGVADYIQDFGADTIYVLGGPAAISDDVVDELEALSNRPSVMRVAGADRYATAAAAGAKIDDETSWCGTDVKSAVLINGASEAIGFGVAIQTFAYRLQLPVLMTASDELPEATANFISDNDIEHVQIIGSTTAVSADVASALTTLGVDAVGRTDGETAAAVSVQLATLAGKGCAESAALTSVNKLAPVSADHVVLVRGNPDGVAAAPILSESLDDGNMVNPLIVGDSLPVVVREYLAATPKTIGTTKLDLGIVAVGGTAAVSRATMDAAIAAATSSGALTAAIGGPTGPDSPVVTDGTTRMFSLYFNDDVADADLDEKVRDIIRINGTPPPIETVSRGMNAGACSLRRVDVTLTEALPLRAGDRISVASSALEFGDNADKRTLAPVTPVTVAAEPRDTTRPTVEIVGIAGDPSNSILIRVHDAGMLDPAHRVEMGDIEFTPAPGSDPVMVTVNGGNAFGAGGTTYAAFSVLLDDTGRDPLALVAGDRLTLAAGVVRDMAGNVNRATTGVVIAPHASPRITSVRMSPLHHSMQARFTSQTASELGATGDHAITIRAKADGAAAGAAGNEWEIYLDRAGSWDATKDVDIDVRVDAKHKQATIRFVNGKATFGDLIAAMRADSEFDALFAVDITCQAYANMGLELDLAAVFAARSTDASTAAFDAETNAGSRLGRTQFALEVRFSGYRSEIWHGELLSDVLADVFSRTSTPADSTALETLITTEFGLDPNDLIADSIGSTTADERGAPSVVQRYEFEVKNTAYLPMSRDLVVTTAGTHSDNAVVLGYAMDDSDTAVREQYNGASQVRIAVSSSVKVR